MQRLWANQTQRATAKDHDKKMTESELEGDTSGVQSQEDCDTFLQEQYTHNQTSGKHSAVLPQDKPPDVTSNRFIWPLVILQSHAAQAPAVTLLSPLSRLDAVRVSQLLLSAKVRPPLLLR